ncbi:TetR/AcrR family transcriptional regulator [Leekyejoonella antrihumi]|uniref:TetR family transcriptional regulator n=1 Tax=Leekyejoonella antrihumi TaxID=1660198 RepID=A0A563E3A9_9MICO|nr:TetR/AcrR family transcriptional regulator [Leekyejoonella antrihumi]TWP37016.1 TetR family transcriptional regulator [Leekyejoonella antrihumi]
MARRRKDAGVRREEILRATAHLIEEHGIALLRVADVAVELDVSPALVVYHFQTKDALIAEALTWAAQQDLDRLALATGGEGSSRDRLFAALAWYAPTGSERGWRLWIENWAAGLREPALRQVGRELDLVWKESLTEIIQAGVAEGDFVTADARGAAWRITALLDGLAVQAIVHRGVVGREQLTAWSMQAVAAELGLDASLLSPGTP